jgi:RNA 2',3'-cyclic 3'-phosphodiesterase
LSSEYLSVYTRLITWKLTIFERVVYSDYYAMKRTFIGLKIDPDPVLSGLFSDLKKNLNSEQLRWVDPQNLHLTLRFLGNTEDSQLVNINNALDALIPQFEHFNLEIEGLGLFGKRNAPKILWAGVNIPQNIYDLVTKIEDIVCNAGFEEETKPYSPHLTLCRIRALSDTSLLLDTVNQYKQTHFLKQDVNQIVLYESVLKSFGAVYVPISIFDLNN